MKTIKFFICLFIICCEATCWTALYQLDPKTLNLFQKIAICIISFYLGLTVVYFVYKFNTWFDSKLK